MMQTSLDHLPPNKQKEIRGVVPDLLEMYVGVELIILFGSHARGDHRDYEDLAPDRKSGAPSDYDILVVCADKEDAEKRRGNLRLHHDYRVITHDIKYVKERLSEIHYFFSDIVREGIVLYTTGKHELYVDKELTPKQQLKVAQEHFDHWFSESKEFFIHFNFGFEREKYRNSSFQLHQAAETAYRAFTLVYTNYASHTHFLRILDDEIHEALPDLEEIFPRTNEAEKECFRNFDYAYIGARYDNKFFISREDLEYFADRVKRLLELTEQRCRERIEDLKKHAAGD